MSEPYQIPEVAAYSTLLAQSFLRVTGVPLIDTADIPEALYHAPFALVSHGTQPDPIFRYANLTAQQLFHLDWHAFTQLPSRLSAPPMAQEERQRLLDKARAQGYVDDYQGVRIAANGDKFKIAKTLLWNVVDDVGIMHGQAALIREWEPIVP